MVYPVGGGWSVPPPHCTLDLAYLPFAEVVKGNFNIFHTRSKNVLATRVRGCDRDVPAVCCGYREQKLPYVIQDFVCHQIERLRAGAGSWGRQLKAAGGRKRCSEEMLSSPSGGAGSNFSG